MPKVKLTQCRVGTLFSQRAGEEVEVGKDEAYHLFRKGQATPVDAESKKILERAEKDSAEEAIQRAEEQAEAERLEEEVRRKRRKGAGAGAGIEDTDDRPLAETAVLK